MSACDGHDTTLAQIEKRVQQFEESSTKMNPQEAAKMASELQQDIDVSWPRETAANTLNKAHLVKVAGSLIIWAVYCRKGLYINYEL